MRIKAMKNKATTIREAVKMAVNRANSYYNLNLTDIAEDEVNKWSKYLDITKRKHKHLREI